MNAPISVVGTHPSVKRTTAVLVALFLILLGPLAGRAFAEPNRRIDLRVLVLTAGNATADPQSAAIATQLDREGVPYTAIDLTAAGRQAIDAAGFLEDAAANQAKFQAVVAPNASPVLSAAEATALAVYEAKYGVRQVDAYSYPGAPIFTVGPVFAGTLDGSAAAVTPAGLSPGPFGYLKGPLTIDNFDPLTAEVFGYLAASVPPTTGTFTPLVTAAAGGQTGSIVGVWAHDGREELVVNAAFNSSMQIFNQLAHGIVTWMTRGIHLGYQRNYFDVHIDDVFLPDSRWDQKANCTPGDDFCTPSVPAPTTRLTTTDAAVIPYLTLAFNGGGSVAALPPNPNTDAGLTAAFNSVKDQFSWINHTYTHEFLGCIQVAPAVIGATWRCALPGDNSPPVTFVDPSLVGAPHETLAPDGIRYLSLSEIQSQIQLNKDWAASFGLPALGLSRYNPAELVTGEHSGLISAPQQLVDNPYLAPALTAEGIAYTASDASRETLSRVIGTTTTVPRHPMNIYYNVGTFQDEVDEYNWIYGAKTDSSGQGNCVNSLTTTCMTTLLDASSDSAATTSFASYILPREVRTALSFVLTNDPRPFYAHQSNLAEDGVLYPVLNGVIAAYSTAYNTANTPLINVGFTAEAAALTQMASWKAAQSTVTAYLDKSGVHLSGAGGGKLPLTMPTAAIGAGLEAYGGELSGWLTTPATDTVVATPPTAMGGYLDVPSAPTIGTATAGDASATVTWSAPSWAGSRSITGYTVKVYAAGVLARTVSLAASPLPVTGLTNGLAYTFDVAATNSVGTGPASAKSAPVTPAVAPPAGGGGTPPAGGGGTSATFTQDRLAGADRIGTAVAVSQSSFQAGAAGAVVLASAGNYPDALVGAPLAAARNAPLLLTQGAALPAATLTEIQRVLRAGGTVDILGGTGAVPAPVATQLTGLGYKVVRFGGIDRYATAAKVADALGAPGRVLLASGKDFPDALTAGSAAASVSGVVLLTNGAILPPVTKTYLRAHPGTVDAVGGSAAAAYPTAHALVGADRYATAAIVARTFFPAPTTVGIATGQNFPDSLAGAAQLARVGGPLLLTTATGLPAPTSAYLGAVKASVSTVHLYGGTAVVFSSVASAVTSSLGH